MYVLLTASPTGFSASLLYGQNAVLGDRGRSANQSDRQARPARILDIAPPSTAIPERNAGAAPRPGPPAVLSAPTAALAYAAPQRAGQAPRLIAATPPPGELLDVFA